VVAPLHPSRAPGWPLMLRLVSPPLRGTEAAPACCVSGSHEGRAMIAHSLVLRTGLFIAVHVGLLAGVLLLL